MMPSAIVNCRGSKFGCHLSQPLEFGGYFTKIVIATTKDSDLVEGQARVDSFLQKLVRRSKIVKGSALNIEGLFKEGTVSVDVDSLDILLDTFGNGLTKRNNL